MAGTSTNYSLTLPVKEDKITESIEQIAGNFNIIDTEMAEIANQVSTEVDDKITDLDSEMNDYKTNLNADITQYKNTVNASLAQLEVVFGVYTGNGEVSRFINLGFTPVAVEVYTAWGAQSSGSASNQNSHMFGGLAIKNYLCGTEGLKYIEIQTNGFAVCTYDGSNYKDSHTNDTKTTYYFKAYKSGSIKVVS